MRQQPPSAKRAILVHFPLLDETVPMFTWLPNWASYLSEEKKKKKNNGVASSLAEAKVRSHTDVVSEGAIDLFHTPPTFLEN